VYHKAILKIMF